MAILIPRLQGSLGRELTDEECERAAAGEFHTCPVLNEVTGKPPVFEEEDRAPMALTEYDWATGKPK
jgi:hypothetical protein